MGCAESKVKDVQVIVPPTPSEQYSKFILNSDTDVFPAVSIFHYADESRILTPGMGKRIQARVQMLPEGVEEQVPETTLIEFPTMTDEVINMAQKQWETFVNDPRFVNNSILIFVKIFELIPETAELFLFVDGITEWELVNNSRLRLHAERVVDSLTVLVSSLQDPTLAIRDIHGIGAKHVTFGFSEENSAGVLAGLLFALESSLKSEFTDYVKETWRNIFNFFLQVMLEGLKAEAMRLETADSDLENCSL